VVASCANQSLNVRLEGTPGETYSHNYSFDHYLEARARLDGGIPEFPIVVTMSGGGLRATAFATAVMNTIRNYNRGGRPLTDDVILVSGTSGAALRPRRLRFTAIISPLINSFTMTSSKARTTRRSCSRGS